MNNVHNTAEKNLRKYRRYYKFNDPTSPSEDYRDINLNLKSLNYRFAFNT